NLGPLHDTGAPAASAIAQDGFEGGLIQEQAPTRAQRLDAFIQIRNDVRQLSACQCLHGDDGAFGNELLRRLSTHGVLDAEVAKPLERSYGKKWGGGEGWAGREALEGQRADPLLGEKGRGREPSQPAAGDQDRCLVRHVVGLRRLTTNFSSLNHKPPYRCRT